MRRIVSVTNLVLASMSEPIRDRCDQLVDCNWAARSDPKLGSGSNPSAVAPAI